MKNRLCSLLVLLLWLAAAGAACAQGTAFTYQGRLHDNGNPANAIYDLRFTIYDALSVGGVAGGPLTNGPTVVSNGLFTATLDFGAGVFSGAARWLEIGVRTNGSVSDFTALAPRQPLTATPYAVRAANATSFSGPVSDAQLTTNVARLSGHQTFSGNVNFSSASNRFAGSFTGNGAGVTNLPLSALVVNTTAPNWTGWGADADGQTDIPPTLVNAVAMAAGARHSLALKSDGTVGAWGFNGSGQLDVPGNVSNVIAVAAGNAHNLALKSDGTVAAWGTMLFFGPATVPDDLSNVVAVAAGNSHNLALKSDGTVAAWGKDVFGVTNVPGNLSAVRSVAAGALHNLALKSNGTVVAWGYNGLGQTNVPGSLSNVVAVAAGGLHSLALKSNGTVVAWGGNGAGQTNVPFNLSNVVAVVAGDAHSVALKSDGTVVVWGDNTYGQTNVPNGLIALVALAPGGAALHVLAGQRPATSPVALLTQDNTFSGNVAVRGLLSGNGSGLTNLNGTQLTAGTVADARLSAKVALLNGNQTFTGVNNFGHPANDFTGSFHGNGAGVTNVNLLTIDSRGAITFTPIYNGNFALASSPVVGLYPYSVVAADVNGDGKVDLISDNYGNDTLTVLTNNGSGGFALASSPGVGSGPKSVVAADVNGDGKTDLISANSYLTNTLTVLTNNGSGGFALASSPGVGSAPLSVTAADVNGDGKVDLISANSGNNNLTVLTNNGTGGFVLASSPGVGSLPVSVTAADVNGDGKVDLISANHGYYTLSVLTNNGSGGFVLASSPVVGSVGSSPQSVVAADVNGDGKVDLISANANDNNLTVLTNNGSGGFVAASSPGVGANPQSVVAADVNGDGKVDLISANFNGFSLTVLTNTPTLTGTFNGSGSGLTGLNAAQLTSGLLPDARLSTNVALRSGGNTFSGDQAITSGNVGIGTPSPSAALDVRDDGSAVKIRANSAGASSFIELNNSTASVRALLGVDGTGFSGTPNQFTIGTWTSHPIKFFINQTERMSINTNGTVTATAFSVLGSGTFEFGAGVAGKESSAGKIGYETFTPGALDIVGAGATVNARKIKFFAEGGATFAGTVAATAFITTSDRNAKSGFTPVDAGEVLAKVAALPISRWHFTNEPGTAHVGPMAQDFRAAFGLGTDERHIATVDADGVALAAIQGLNQKLEEKETRITALEKELAEIKRLLLKKSEKKE